VRRTTATPGRHRPEARHHSRGDRSPHPAESTQGHDKHETLDIRPRPRSHRRASSNDWGTLRTISVSTVRPALPVSTVRPALHLPARPYYYQGLRSTGVIPADCPLQHPLSGWRNRVIVAGNLFRWSRSLLSKRATNSSTCAEVSELAGAECVSSQARRPLSVGDVQRDDLEEAGGPVIATASESRPSGSVQGPTATCRRLNERAAAFFVRVPLGADGSRARQIEYRELSKCFGSSGATNCLLGDRTASPL